jgi:Zn-dependent protease with chaperone function
VATSLNTFAAVFVLLLPIMFSAWLRRIAVTCAANGITAPWVKAAAWMRFATVMVVPGWWTYTDWVFTYRQISPVVPLWILLILPTCASVYVARIIGYSSDALVFDRKWTAYDIHRLAFWRTVSSTLPLLLFALGIDGFRERNTIAVLWLFAAGLIGLLALARLHWVEGVRFRRVKSGDFYKRAFVLARRMGVPLRRVAVVPFGRGHLTNAYSRGDEIAITDDYGHWLSGSRLDFVVGHELAHAKNKHGRKKLLITIAVFVAVSLPAFVLPHVHGGWHLLFNIVVIVAPVLILESVSRRFEYVADHDAVKLTGDVIAAAQSLVDLYRHVDVPAELGMMQRLLSSHPGLWQRIEAISRIGNLSAHDLARIRAGFGKTASASER